MEIHPSQSFTKVRWAIIISSVLLPSLFWFYLALTTQFIIVHDSAGYEGLGRLLNNVGWIEFIKCGPHREPLYPCLVSVCMRMADFLNVSYPVILKVAHIALLWTTQGLMFVLLKKLRVGAGPMAAALLYFGMSPSVIHSAFSFYSEVLVFPLIVLMVLCLIRSSRTLQDEQSLGKIILSGTILGGALALITFVKGVFELITFLCLVPFVVLLSLALKRKNMKSAVVLLFFLASVLIAFHVPVTGYKFLNKQLNGRLTLTDRGPWALYGNTARRMETLTPRMLGASLAYVPGHTFCEQFFTKDSCLFWSTEVSDQKAQEMMQTLKRQHILGDNMDRRLVRMSIDKALSNLPQYILLSMVEGLKFFFWESADVGLTAYPDWVENIVQTPMINQGLKFFMAGVTLLSMGWLGFYLRKGEIKMRMGREENPDPVHTLFWIAFVVLVSITAHSPFFVVPRYTLFLIPLYLVILSFLLNDFHARFTRTSGHCIAANRRDGVFGDRDGSSG